MQTSISKLRQVLLPLYDSREVRAIIQLLFEEVCGLSKVDMILHPELILPEEQRAILDSYCPRLANGEPIQYVLGYERFLGRRFEVNSSVLIPRPETAELVEWIVEEERVKLKNEDGMRDGVGNAPRILDIGTGSGCIALSLAALINNSTVVATDLSTSALETARRNAQSLKISNISFVEMDILSAQDKTFQWGDVDKFDIIVSNPPYVLHNEKQTMESNVLDFEPHLALFVPDDDPILFYRAIAHFGRMNLADGGRLFFEINTTMGKAVCKLLSDLGYNDIRLKKDSFGLDRMITAKI